MISSLIFYYLLIVLAILIVYHFWVQSLRYTKLGNKLPGDYPLPIIGNCSRLLKGINKDFKELMQLCVDYAEEHGEIARFWFGPRLGVLLRSPEDIELILGSKNHLEKTREYDLFKPWLGDGLLISKGETWYSHRKMIAPTFHHSILKTFVPVFNKNADNLVNQLRQNALGRVLDIHDNMAEATVDTLLETVMGIKKNDSGKLSSKYAKAVMNLCGILHKRHVQVWLRLDFIFRFTKMFKVQKESLETIHDLCKRVIINKKKDYFERVQKGDTSLYSDAVKETNRESSEENGLTYGSNLRDDLDVDDETLGNKKRLAFLDFMIEASQTEGNKLDDKDIKDEVNTIMFEGHDTTAAASSFFICLLGVYPEIQEKVFQELQDIFQQSERPITFNDTLQMKYLERVFLETLRLYPPVPIITRVISEDVKLVSADYILPKGTSVGITPYLTHRNPKYFPNPTKFDPDNFLPERCHQRHYYSFIPFSAGSRSCVGRKYAMLKLKILLAQIVRNFRIKSVVSENDFQLQGDIILKRADGFRVILEDRKS